MTRRPTILVIMGLLLALLALAPPIQIMVVDKRSLTELPDIFSQFSLFQWLVFILASSASVLILQASHWVRVLLPALTIIVLGHHFRHWQDNGSSLLNVSLATVGFLALNIPLIHPNIMKLMSYPERRWWRNSPRRIVELPIFLGGCLKGTARTKTYEISETGAYVTFPPGPMPQFQLEEIVSVCITIGVLKQIRCQGRVVRIGEANGRYPRGLGVEFSQLTWEDKRDLRRFVSLRS